MGAVVWGLQGSSGIYMPRAGMQLVMHGFQSGMHEQPPKLECACLPETQKAAPLAVPLPACSH